MASLLEVGTGFHPELTGRENIYLNGAILSMTRQDQMHLLTDPKYRPDKDRFLHVEMFTGQPMTQKLSGFKVEYTIALIYSSEAGKREEDGGRTDQSDERQRR